MCVRFDNVVRYGGIYNVFYLFVKGIWLFFVFSILVYDGLFVWIGKVDKDFILNYVGKLGMIELEYVDIM